MRPWVVPVGRDGSTSSYRASKLKGTGSSVVVAGELRIGGIRDRVAE